MLHDLNGSRKNKNAQMLVFLRLHVTTVTLSGYSDY